MELWQVKKRYRQVAAKLKRRAVSIETGVQYLEAQVLLTLGLCDRAETELSVLRMARRCAKARLRRLRQWVENAALLKSSPLRLVVHKEDELAAEELERALVRSGANETAQLFRQLRHELAALDERMTEAKMRLNRTAALAAEKLNQLTSHASFPSARLEPHRAGG